MAVDKIDPRSLHRVPILINTCFYPAVKQLCEKLNNSPLQYESTPLQSGGYKQIDD